MVTLGADPEFFIQTTEGAPHPICGLLGGSKLEPTAMPEIGDGFAVQEDNVMAEYNVPPARSMDEFANNIRIGLAGAAARVSDREGSMSILRASEVLFNYDQLDNPHAQVFGCSEDYQAHDQGSRASAVDGNACTDPGGLGEWRYAGGHVHIGYSNPHKVPDFVAAQFADLYIGLRSIGRDSQRRRRATYGQAGRYRPTAYGIEYRTLSNYWIFSNSRSGSVAHGGLRLGLAIEKRAASLQDVYKDVPWRDVATAINTDNAELGRDLIAYVHSLGLEV